MNSRQTELARKQLERRLAPLRKLALDAPSRGWIRAIRDALGMTTVQLATRMDVAQSRVAALEKAETTGRTTLRSLREAAAALDCAFVYAFVPIEPLDEMLRRRAVEKAAGYVARLDHTMRLENQASLRSDLADEQQRTVQLLLAGPLKALWDDEPPAHA